MVVDYITDTYHSNPGKSLGSTVRSVTFDLDMKAFADPAVVVLRWVQMTLEAGLVATLNVIEVKTGKCKKGRYPVYTRPVPFPRPFSLLV